VRINDDPMRHMDAGTFVTLRRLFVAWTIFSALAVWLALSVAETLAAERCSADGLLWNWKAWSCAQPRGTIILPSALRRADVGAGCTKA